MKNTPNNDICSEIKAQLNEDIRAIGSDAEVNYYDDFSVTIFLKNGYRIISNKEVLGSSLSIEFFDKKQLQHTSVENIYSEVMNEVWSNDQKPCAKYYKKNSDYKNVKLTQDAFLDLVNKIVPNKVVEFLNKRHSYLLFQTALTNKPYIEQYKSDIPNNPSEKT